MSAQPKGNICNNCGKNNHFAAVCRGTKKTPAGRKTNPRQPKQKYPKKQTVKAVTQENAQCNSDSDSDDSGNYLYAIYDKIASPVTQVTVEGHKFDITVDTGVAINFLDGSALHKMKNVNLKPADVKAYSLNHSTSVKFMGKFGTVFETKHRLAACTFYVTESVNGGCFLSNHTAQELGLVSIHINKLNSTTNAKKSTHLTKLLTRCYVNELPEKFERVCKLKNHKVTLNINNHEIATGCTKPTQDRILFHMRDRIKHDFKDLEQRGIIQKVPENQASPWVSPVVAVPKKNWTVRLCVDDMCRPNTAIRSTRHLIPTVNEVSF